jgi:diadenosine tetraphosphate (Ap4A) HIT family hydrolase
MLIPGCVSCDILAGKRTPPGGTIYENECWRVDSVLSPVVWRGFLIIKLKRRCEHLAELTHEEAAMLGPVIRMTCAAVSEALKPAKVYVCSFGDGVKHIHFWVLPRPQKMRPGMHSVMRNLDVRMALTRFFGVKKWIVSDEEAASIAERLRQNLSMYRG